MASEQRIHIPLVDIQSAIEVRESKSVSKPHQSQEDVLVECVKSESDPEEDVVRRLEQALKALPPDNREAKLKQLHMYYRPNENVTAFTLLHYATNRGRYERAAVLLRYCRNPEDLLNMKPEFGTTEDSAKTQWKSVLELAIDKSYAKLARLYVAKGARFDSELFFRVLQSKGFKEVAGEMLKKTYQLALLKKTFKTEKTSYLTFAWKEDNTPFRELIRFHPDLARVALDDCIKHEGYREQIYRQGHRIIFSHDIVDDFQMEGREQSSNWGPVKYTKHNHTLSIMVRHKREDLLDHPVVASLIHDKWQKFGFLIYYLNLIFFAFFLALLTSFALVVRNPQSNQDCSFMLKEANITGCSDFSGSERIYPVLSAVGIIIMSCVYIIKQFYEFTQLISEGIYYFLNLTNWIRPVLFPCCIIFVAMPNWECPCVFEWQWQIGAVAILLAWLDFILSTSKFPVIGIYVTMFVEIWKTFLKLAFLTTLLVLAFGLTFFMIFSDPRVSRSSFGTGFRALVRTLVMLTGELDYDGIFRLDSSDPDNDGPELAYLYTAYIIWVPFLILVPILFTNLLIGLATGEVSTIQKEAEFRVLAQHIDYILTLERIWPWLRKRFRPEHQVEPNKTKNLKGKILDRIKFFGWRSKYNTIDSYFFPEEQSDLNQIKTELAELKGLMKEILERKADTHDVHTVV